MFGIKKIIVKYGELSERYSDLIEWRERLEEELGEFTPSNETEAKQIKNFEESLTNKSSLEQMEHGVNYYYGLLKRPRGLFIFLRNVIRGENVYKNILKTFESRWEDEYSTLERVEEWLRSKENYATSG